MEVSYFAGVGAQLWLAPRSEPGEYWFVELVPGYEAAGTSEVGNSAGVAVALRAGVNLTHATFALGTTMRVAPTTSSRSYMQSDLTFVVGFHGGLLSD